MGGGSEDCRAEVDIGGQAEEQDRGQARAPLAKAAGLFFGHAVPVNNLQA